MVRRVIISVLLLGLLLGGAACQGRVSTVELTATNTLPATESVMIPTEPPTRVPPTETIPTETVPPPTASATPIPSVTPSPTVPPTDTPAPTSAAPFLTATAKRDATKMAAEVAVAVDATLAALPSATPYPTYTPLPSETPVPTLPPTETPAPILTPTVDLEGTRTANEVARAELAAAVASAVEATVAALPSATPYPTYTLVPSETPVPTLTPTETPSPTLTPTVDLEGTRTANEAARAELAAAIASAVEATVAALPSETPVPTLTPTETPAPTLTPSPTLEPTVAPTDTPAPTLTPTIDLAGTRAANAATLTAWPTATATPTAVPPTETPAPTLTPSHTALVPPILPTAEPPTATRPPTDLFATATALAATQMSIQATEVAMAGATQTQIALDRRATETAWLLTQTVMPSPTIDLNATATAIVAAVTATAEAVAAQPLGLVFDVPPGWGTPVQADLNTLQLSDGTALIFLYRGGAAFFEPWGIPADETDLVAAAEALAGHTGGAIQPYEGKAAIPVLLPDVREGKQGVLYLARLADGDWLLLSGSAPADALATYQAEVFEPLLLSLEVAGPEPPAMRTPQPTRTPIVIPPTATPTIVPPTAPPALRTPQPTRTPIVIPPTATPTTAPLTLVSTSSAALGLTFDAPQGWTETAPPDLNLPDGNVAGVIFYAAADDAANPSGRAGHPALLALRVMPGDYALDLAGEEPAAVLVSLFAVPEESIQPFDAAYPAARAVIARPAGASVAYALALGADDWAVVTVVAPPGYNALELDEQVLVPLVRSLAVSGEA